MPDLSQLPRPDAEFGRLSRYAHTINGYHLLSLEQGLDLVELLRLKSRVADLDGAGPRRLRLGLFFLLREMHWSYDGGSDDDERLVKTDRLLSR